MVLKQPRNCIVLKFLIPQNSITSTGESDGGQLSFKSPYFCRICYPKRADQAMFKYPEKTNDNGK